MTRSALAVALLGVLALGLSGCAEPATDSSPAASAAASPSLAGSITVDAAASLNTVFPKLAKAFMAEHPGTRIAFSFGGSSTLAAQIVSGAPVDVFAAASTKTMQTVVDAKLAATSPVVLARNRLEIAVPPSNPGDITGLKDFADGAKTIVVCDQEVPCGAAAKQVFTLGGITAKPDSYEPDVTSVLAKVESADADAGLVYVTDVKAAGDKVEGVPFGESDRAVTDYPIAPLKGARDPQLAKAFVSYVVAHGGAALLAAGFLAPR